MKWAKRWLNPVLPPFSWTAVFVLLYVLSELPYLYVLFQHRNAIPELHRMRDAVLVIAAGLYAFWRVVGYHPYFDGDHRRWLEATPWTAARPLPNGPVHLVPQDAIVLAMLSAPLAFGATIGAAVPLVAFLVVYLLVLSSSFLRTGQGRLIYLVLFGLGAMARYGDQPGLLAGLGVATYLVALLGLRRSLQGFPWDFPKVSFSDFFTSKNKGSALAMYQALAGRELLGWPYDRLTPKPSTFRIRALDGALIALLTGWYLYVATWQILQRGGPPGDALAFVLTQSVMLVFVLAIIRISLYLSCRWSPMSIWARFVTLRWFLPKFDRSWWGPLSGFLMTIALSWGVQSFGNLPPAIAAAIPAPIGVFIVLSARPTFLEWQLTGHHRLVHGMSKSTDELIEI